MMAIMQTSGTEPIGETLIEGYVRECNRAFNRLAIALKEAQPSISKGSTEATIVGERGRFHIWCGDVGANLSGEKSLDCRLRDAPHHIRTLSVLLAELQKTLDNGIYSKPLSSTVAFMGTELTDTSQPLQSYQAKRFLGTLLRILITMHVHHVAVKRTLDATRAKNATTLALNSIKILRP